MNGSSCSSLRHPPFHCADSILEPLEHRTRNDCVTDIELDNLIDFGNRSNVAVMQPMAGIDDEAKLMAIAGGADDALEFLLLPYTIRIRVAARMQLNDGRACGYRRIELRRLRIDKQRYSDARFRKLTACVTHFIQLAHNVQTALCCKFFPFFRYEA